MGALTPRRRTALIVAAPIVSVATLMLGLRVGAGSAVHAASVFAAPPGKPPGPGAPVPFVWQVLTYLEDRGVRETIPVRGLTVVARSEGKESRWTGASNEDGIAEATLAIADLSTKQPLTIEVLAEGEPQPLASGAVDWKTPASWGRDPNDDGSRAVARPSKREGALSIDVLVEGERLVVGDGTTLWIHIGGASKDVALEINPEPGLLVDRSAKTKCDGLAELTATAQGHVVGMEVVATSADGGKRGVWFGALPVAPGAFFVGHPRVVPEGHAETAVLVAPNPRKVAYAEVDDEVGRVFAAALAVAPERDGVSRARFAMPALAPGLHWIVVSGEPRGAEHMSGATIAKPFLVSSRGDGAVRADEQAACSVGPWLARRPATGFPRRLAVDGMATRGASNRLRHRIGLFIGLLSLFAAAVLEVLLLTAAAREARAVLLLAELETGDASTLEGTSRAHERERLTARAPGGGIAVAILVALLGFALLAALMIAKG